MQNKWQCRIAPSLGDGFAGTPNQVWGTVLYQNETDPTVFFGCYGLPDFFALWRHKGRRAVLWCGSDIRHLINGYWLDEGGKIKLSPHSICKWLDQYCENYVENGVEYEALRKAGIKAQIIPSFLGNMNDYPLLYKPSDRPKLYTSVSGNDFALYGWDKISELANKNAGIEFHLYGNTTPPMIPAVNHNVIIHGRVPQEVMNAEIKEMQGALRLVEFDGFSEIVAKSILWGQWPVSVIQYPHTISLKDIGSLKDKKTPNTKGREHFIKILNAYPWNSNVQKH